ncbi:MAG TPA: APC family permease, partial [Acidimicrobiales bacterium]|nr:APC family permease [Acidimicrobiales bacterium]
MTDTTITRGQLRRALGLRTVVTTSTGLAFAALEYLAAAGLVAYVAGDSAWIPILVAGVLALIAWGFFGELNSMFPTAAAIRLYMKRAMDDRAALTITFTYMTTIVLVIASDAFIVGSALDHAFGEPAWVTALWIVGLLAVAVATNLRGITVAGLLQDLATTVVIVATLVIAVLALVHSGHGLHTPFQPLRGHGTGSFLQAVALGVFLYSAFEWVTTSAEEVRKSESIGRGMLIAIGILCVVCAVATEAMSHTLTHHELTSAYPQLYLGVAAIGHSGLWVMAGVTAVTALNTFNGGFITASRFIYGTAREGALPRQAAHLNDWAVPWVPVVVLGVVSAVVALLVAVTHAWQVLVAVGAALEGMIYGVAGFCVLRLRRRQPDAPRPFRFRGLSVLGPLGVALFAVLALTASVSVQNKFNPAPLLIIVACGALSLFYVLRVLPGINAREAARRAARPRRR